MKLLTLGDETHTHPSAHVHINKQTCMNAHMK